MTDVTDIVRRTITETVADEETGIRESLADPISNVITGDPRLHRSDPDSAEEVAATVDIVDDATNQVKLGSFGASDPEQLREAIVTDVEDKLVTDIGQSSAPNDTNRTSNSSLASENCERLLSVPTFRTDVKDSKENTIVNCSTGKGKTKIFIGAIVKWLQSFIENFRANPTVDDLSNWIIHSRQNPQNDFRSLISLDCTDSCWDNSMENQFLNWYIESGEFADQMEFHEQQLTQYLAEFQKHKERSQIRLDRAKYCDDMIGAREFRKASRERLEAEQAAWMLFSHLQASTLKSSLQTIRYYQELGDQSPFTDGISCTATDGTVHLIIDWSQFYPEQQDMRDVSFSDAASFEWDSIDETLSVVWDGLDCLLFQALQDDIIDRPDPSLIAPSEDSDSDSL